VSFDLIKAVLAATVPLTKGELSVLVVLASHVNHKTGACFPSQRTILRESRFKSRRGVQKILERLVARRLVTVVGPATFFTSARYRIELAALRGEPSSPGAPSSPGEPSSLGRRTQFPSEANPVRPPGEPSSPEQRNNKELNRKRTIPALRAAAVAATDDAFETFWRVYPRKAAKADALKVFTKLAPDQQLVETMLDALDWQTQSPAWQKHGGEYVPYPATWLRGRRWEDARPHGEHVDPTDAAWDALMRRHARKGVPQ